ncbi:hypothetical protein BpHYR1_020871 [Brachionus plicatilis]|uniref:Uncharacterized protein n=1 Tax=Brachionus plicatilis TaxID=10195 RepID=A0A3M7SZI5_BRAPC|nr:hypothetical protein BpHYR1_020871 [Brachionus plicatilis]
MSDTDKVLTTNFQFQWLNQSTKIRFQMKMIMFKIKPKPLKNREGYKKRTMLNYYYYQKEEKSILFIRAWFLNVIN